MISILAVSDSQSWISFEEVMKNVNPDIVVFCGDVIAEGVAEYQTPSQEFIQRTIEEENLEHKSYFSNKDYINKKYWDSTDFIKARKKHIKKFYEALELASKKCEHALIIRGNHDEYEEFPEEYDINKINSIQNCIEISGKMFQFSGIKFLGLSYTNCHYLKQLRPLIQGDKPDIVIAHPEHRRLVTIAEYKPKLVIHGHCGIGYEQINGIDFIGLSVFPTYSIIKFDEISKSVEEVVTYHKIYHLGERGYYKIHGRMFFTEIANGWIPDTEKIQF